MKAILVLVTALGFAAGSTFTPGFGGFAPDQFPYPVADLPLTPAGFAFSIWGLIFLALIASGLFGLLKRDTDPAWDRTRWPLIAVQTLGATWVALAVWSPPVATVAIWIMLALALVAAGRSMKSTDTWWLQVPLMLLAGWLTAASWVGLTTLAVGYIEGLSQITGSWIGLVLALITAIACLTWLRSPAYAAAVIWALIGVIAANAGGGWMFLTGVVAGAAAIAGVSLRQVQRG